MGRKDKNPDGKTYEHEDAHDIRKSLRKENKSIRKKEKEMLDYLVHDDDTEVEEYYDNFEKW